MYLKPHSSIFAIVIIAATTWAVYAGEAMHYPILPKSIVADSVNSTMQINNNRLENVTDTLKQVKNVTDSFKTFTDSVSIPDTINNDSAQQQKTKNNKPVFDTQVKYTADDSIIFELEDKTVHLYGNAHIVYSNIDLTAGYIKFNMANEEVYAKGILDSTGTNTKADPVFKQGNDVFNAKEIRYNFKSKRGMINQVKTHQGEGYLHGDSTKRQANGHIHFRNGKYTTCDKDHPHFYLALTKAKAVPNDKIVSGPAYLVVEDIPLPLGIPFGFFPNTKDAKSGVRIPSYRDDRVRGLGLVDAGYYWYINEHADADFTAEIYSKLSWGVRGQGRYKQRYKYSGNMNLSYFSSRYGEEGTPDYSKQTDFNIIWNHTQDAKANPNSTFGASVNMSSSGYDQKVSRNAQQAIQSSKQSSINYSYRWPNSPFNLNTSLSQNQNSLTKDVNLQLPSANLNMNAIYPFRKSEPTAKPAFYEDIQITYNATLQNDIKTKDSLLFTNRMWDNMQTGLRHNVPLSRSFKINSFITLVPSINYDGILVTKTQKVTWNETKKDPRYADLGSFDTTTYKSLRYAHGYFPNLGLNVTPKFYGMYQFKNSNIKVIRHVMSPRADFSYTPDVRDIQPGKYYHDIKDANGMVKGRYSEFGNSPMQPRLPDKESGGVGLSLNNTIEMKYRSAKDTTNTDKKIMILENLDASTRYNFFADSFNWGPVNLRAGTRLFEGKLDIQSSANIDLYHRNKMGRSTPYLALNKKGYIGHLTNFNISFGTSFQSGAGKGKDKPKTDNNANNNQMQQNNNPNNVANQQSFGNQVDYDIPWTFRVNYTVSYSKYGIQKPLINQTFNVDGDLSLTPKWKVGIRTGYDFVRNEVSYTNIAVSRDLHCWEMRFNMVPIGPSQSYFFTINVKSAMLRDLKFDRRNHWYDTF